MRSKIYFLCSSDSRPYSSFGYFLDTWWFDADIYISLRQAILLEQVTNLVHFSHHIQTFSTIRSKIYIEIINDKTKALSYKR